MKLTRLLAALAFTAASALPAAAHTLVFETSLSGLNENPTNDSAGTGTARVTVDLDLFTMRVQTTFSGLTGTVTAAHIHCCVDSPTNIGVATITPSFTGFPHGGTGGTYDFTYDMTLAASYNAAFLNNPSFGNGSVSGAFEALVDGLEAGNRAYLNIHTTYRSGGEIRGHLALVPEPGAYALMLAGLGLVGWVARRRSMAA